MTDSEATLPPVPQIPDSNFTLPAFEAYSGLLRDTGDMSMQGRDVDKARQNLRDAERASARLDRDYPKLCGEMNDAHRNSILLSGALSVISAFLPGGAMGKLLGSMAGTMGRANTAMGYNSDVRRAEQACDRIYRDVWEKREDIARARQEYYDAITRETGLTSQAVSRKRDNQRLQTEWDSYAYDWGVYLHRLDPQYPMPKVKFRQFAQDKSFSQAESDRAAQVIQNYVT